MIKHESVTNTPTFGIPTQDKARVKSVPAREKLIPYKCIDYYNIVKIKMGYIQRNGIFYDDMKYFSK